MVILKTTTGAAHLETIYEEPSNWNGSGNQVQPLVNQQAHTDTIVTGLISARSLPPVNAQRQQPVESSAKPPIEVRFRDGSKRYIHSDNENAAAGTEASVLELAQANAAAAYYQNQQPNSGQERVQRRPPIVITIISAKDLRHIEVASTDISSPEPTTPSPMIHSTPRLPHTFTSPATSSTISTPFQPVPSLEQTALNQQSILAHSQSTSTVGTLRSKKSAYKVSFAPLPHTAYIQASLGTAVDQAGANARSPSTSSQLSQDLSLTINSSQRSNASESHSLHSKQSTPSLQHSLSGESEHRQTSSSGTPASNYTAEQANMALSIGGGAHSAFRPFLRQMRLNHKSFPINKRMPFTVNMRSLRPSQRQQMLSYVQYYNQHRQQQPRQPWGNHQQQNPAAILANFTQLPAYSMAGQNENLTVSNPHSALALPNVLDIRTGPGRSISIPASPSVPWHNITSNSIYEIPRLAKRFDSIPLRITLPVVSPHFNQKALVHHNTALERRLLNAGLSPETVALYERVLDIGKTLPPSPLSPPQLSDRP